MFTFILHLHFLGDVEQMTNELNTEFDKNEQFQEKQNISIRIRKGPPLKAEYNIRIRKGHPLFLNFKDITT